MSGSKYDENGARIKRKCNNCYCHFAGTVWDCESCDCWMDEGVPIDSSKYPTILIIIPVRSRSDINDETLDLIHEAFEDWCTDTGDWWNWKIRLATAKGYGNAIRKVMRDSPGFDVYMTCSDDFATPAKYLPPMANMIVKGWFDMVVGCRRFSSIRAPRTAIRGLASNLYNIIFSKIFATGLSEHWGDTRAFSARVVKELVSNTRENGFFWIPECIVTAQRLGYNVTEVPVLWDKRATPSPLNFKRLWEERRNITGIPYLKKRVAWFNFLNFLRK